MRAWREASTVICNSAAEARRSGFSSRLSLQITPKKRIFFMIILCNVPNAEKIVNQSSVCMFLPHGCPNFGPYPHDHCIQGRTRTCLICCRRCQKRLRRISPNYGRRRLLPLLCGILIYIYILILEYNIDYIK